MGPHASSAVTIADRLPRSPIGGPVSGPETSRREELLIEPTIDRRIAVTVIGGYLGAGKTTLVNHVLRTADERVAVLVNDFGDINIDAALIESENGDTISLANGCICCSLVDGFAAALETVQGLDPAPRRLVIEASGVADPAQVAAYGHGPGLRLDAIVVVVDAETVRQRSRDRYVGETVLAQIRSADILVLNKVDLVDGPAARDTATWLRAQTGGAVIADVARAEVDPALLFGVARSTDVASGGPGRPSASADDVFRSWSWSSDEPVGRDVVERLMSALPESVVRAKGVLVLADDSERVAILQRVGARWSLRPLANAPAVGATTSQLVLIGLPDAISESWLDDRLTARPDHD